MHEAEKVKYAERELMDTEQELQGDKASSGKMNRGKVT